MAKALYTPFGIALRRDRRPARRRRSSSRSGSASPARRTRPAPRESEYGWKEILPAAALQGAIFARREGHARPRGRAGRPEADRRLAGRLTTDGGKPMPARARRRARDARGQARGRGADDGRAPDSPADLGGSSKKDTLKRTFKEFSADNLTDWAAALTYYGVLAVFPALIALVSILGLIGPSATDPLIENLGQRRARPGEGHPHERHREPDEQPGRGRHRVRHRPRARAELGVELHRRVHARVERDLRGRGGPADLEAQAAADRHHARAARAARGDRAWP